LDGRARELYQTLLAEHGNEEKRTMGRLAERILSARSLEELGLA
jgi:hypothetical protein